MTAQTDLRDGAGKTRRLSAAEKVLFSLARSEGKTATERAAEPTPGCVDVVARGILIFR